ncbi:hypothetical protein VNO77_18777 [Canavalia gladiata]|uniref:Uncharacterized protein n=1 Tax=Canavalia gladiata TaxID=3824 RepID=A0AAN9LLD8_CANGL
MEAISISSIAGWELMQGFLYVAKALEQDGANPLPRAPGDPKEVLSNVKLPGRSHNNSCKPRIAISMERQGHNYAAASAMAYAQRQRQAANLLQQQHQTPPAFPPHYPPPLVPSPFYDSAPPSAFPGSMAIPPFVVE